MRVNNIKKIGLGFVFGMIALVGAAQVTNAQIRIYTETDRYNQDGRYDDQREMLRQAVNRGYQQGFRQGQLDRRYGRRMNYYNSGMYQNGTYGYRNDYGNRNGYGYAGDMRSRYQRAFQRGFERGYEDGYNSQNRYGYRTNNGLQVIGSILNSIVNSSQ